MLKMLIRFLLIIFFVPLIITMLPMSSVGQTWSLWWELFKKGKV